MFTSTPKIFSAITVFALTFAFSTANAQVDIPLGSSEAASVTESLDRSIERGVYPTRGSKGQSVRELQQALKDMGYSVAVDGDFGARTQNALRSFQRSNNLKADGVLGPTTLRNLKTDLARVRAEQSSQAAASEEAAAAEGAGSGSGETEQTEGGANAIADALGLDKNEPAAGGGSGSGDGALKEAVEAGDYLREGSTGPAVEELQRRLNEAGIETPTSGEFDSATQDAVRELQNRQGANSDGVVGPQTLDALEREEAGEEAPEATANWMAIARSQLGVRERSGSANNPTIQQYHRQGGLSAREPDSTAWCSSFANWVMKRAGQGGTNRANARSWLGYGRRISQPVPGCIVVFWRESRSSWKGHVAFYVSDAGGSIRVLGGNQSDSVNIQSYAKSRVLEYRWPTNVPLPR